MNGSRMRSVRNHKVSGIKWKRTQNNPKLISHSKGSSEKEVHSYTDLPKNNRKSWNKQHHTPTRTQGTTTKTTQSK